MFDLRGYLGCSHRMLRKVALKRCTSDVCGPEGSCNGKCLLETFLSSFGGMNERFPWQKVKFSL
jgi:hypothetical protein